MLELFVKQKTSASSVEKETPRRVEAFVEDLEIVMVSLSTEVEDIMAGVST